MRSDRHQTILFIIILLVLSLGIGYAFLTATLTIDGVSDIDSANWDIHFENVQVQSGSVTGEQVTTPATISADGQTVSYHVKLKEPGDSYVFNVNIVNDGTIDAVIENIIYRINDEFATVAPAYIAEYVLYDLDEVTVVNVGDYINAGETKKLLVGIHYREDVSPSELPTTDESLNISFQIVYSQAEKGQYLYTVIDPSGTSDWSLKVGDSLPNISNFNTFEDANSMVEYPSCVRLKVRNNVILEKAVCFTYNGRIYCVIGDDGSSYNSNLDVLNSAFDSELCSASSNGFNCSDDGIAVNITEYGYVGAFDDYVNGCFANQYGIGCGNLGDY